MNSTLKLLISLLGGDIGREIYNKALMNIIVQSGGIDKSATDVLEDKKTYKKDAFIQLFSWDNSIEHSGYGQWSLWNCVYEIIWTESEGNRRDYLYDLKEKLADINSSEPKK